MAARWGCAAKGSLDASPSPVSSPLGEDFTGYAFGLFDDRSANPVAGFSRRRRAFLLLLGEKAGMREDVEPFHFGNGSRRDAENGHRDGRAPQQWPSRAANGSLGWTTGQWVFGRRSATH